MLQVRKMDKGIVTVVAICYERYGSQVYTDYASCREALSSIKKQLEFVSDPDPCPTVVLSHRGNHTVISGKDMYTDIPLYNMEFIISGVNDVCKKEMSAFFHR
mgnify:CR=1 FL=1